MLTAFQSLAGIEYLATEGAGRTTVLLHGIGSGAQSWQHQLDRAKAAGERVLAWNAPGYGASQNLVNSQAKAEDYAIALWRWLDRLQIADPIHLVGHSLGALVAVSAAKSRVSRIARLSLLSPALGYGLESEQSQQEIIHQRLSSLKDRGFEGMAALRAPAMLGPGASDAKIESIRAIMRQLKIEGYTQAVHLLAGGRLLTDLQELVGLSPRLDIAVACGSADTVTPPAKCKLAADAAGTSLVDLGAYGHVCAMDCPDQVNRFLGLGNTFDAATS
jgi:pimeloyl-ACP methyl ester carboxylesterase